jgi:hypothetical protein
MTKQHILSRNVQSVDQFGLQLLTVGLVVTDILMVG